MATAAPATSAMGASREMTGRQAESCILLVCNLCRWELVDGESSGLLVGVREVSGCYERSDSSIEWETLGTTMYSHEDFGPDAKGRGGGTCH
jgi:hypothetical protein